jgi:DNA-binding PadR family transcriptional regulator
MHGFEIMEEIFERTGRVWKPGPGTIYPTLSWLEENGYVESTVEIRGEKARKPYKITSKGSAALKEYQTVKREGLESLEWMRSVWKDM